MITTKDRQAFSDVCIIIKMMPKSMEEKINPSFIKFIEDNKDTKYISNINKEKPLKNQVLNENTKEILALIYRDYLCSDSIRKKLLEQERREIEEKEEENRKKYEIHFKNKEVKQNIIEKDTSLIVYKEESIIKKIIHKIKKLLKLK